jgi:flagellar L-ring protein precursor FlgH
VRKALPSVLLLLVACSLPKQHDERLLTKPAIPRVEEAPSTAPLSEGSLWRDRNLLSDLRASRLNDLVTLRISESTNAITKADVSTSRAGASKYSAPDLFKLLPSGNTADRATGTTNKYAGTGSTGRSATFTTTLTARVVKVLGNGNLIVEGYRDIQLNHETQRLYVAGLIDPARLDATNTIASGQVAELRVGYGGSGVVDETLKPGYISRLLNYIWPF